MLPCREGTDPSLRLLVQSQQNRRFCGSCSHFDHRMLLTLSWAKGKKDFNCAVADYFIRKVGVRRAWAEGTIFIDNQVWYPVLRTTKERGLRGHHCCPYTAVKISHVCHLNHVPSHLGILSYPWVPGCLLLLNVEWLMLEGLWGFILHLNVLTAGYGLLIQGDNTSCSVVERKGKEVLAPV